MTFKLATAAAMVLASATASNAADLAKKAPAAVDYVKVCDTYGAGFFYIPGSETCLKIGGYMRMTIMTGDNADLGGDFGGERGEKAINTKARFALTADARSMTEYGLLRGFTELEFNVPADNSTEGVAISKAYIQWGGWSAGHKGSNWDFFTGYALGDTYGSHTYDNTVNLLSYTFGLGNGVTATLGVEDTTYSRVGAQYGGEKAMDVVGNVNVTQAWGAAQVMAALHQDYGNTAANDAGWGYAVGAGVKVALPMLGAGSEVALQAAYSSGAVRYTSGSITGADDFVGGDQSDSWSIHGGIKHAFSPSLVGEFDMGYVSYDEAGSIAADLDVLTVRASVAWTPVTNLTIRPGVEYVDRDFGTGGVDVDGWTAAVRITRSF